MRELTCFRRIRGQVEGWKRRAQEAESAESTEIFEAADELLEGLKSIEVELVQTEPDSETGRLRRPVRLDEKLEDLTSVVSCVDAAPPKQAYDVFEHLSGMVDEPLSKLQSLIEADVAAFNILIQSAIFSSRWWVMPFLYIYSAFNIINQVFPMRRSLRTLSP